MEKLKLLFRVLGLGFRDIPPSLTENKLEKKVASEMETGYHLPTAQLLHCLRSSARGLGAEGCAGQRPPRNLGRTWCTVNG